MSTIDGDDEKLPPLWGNSLWWTRTGALLGLASLIAGVAMVALLARNVGPCGLPNQLTIPTLAIEVAGSWDDVAAMAGPCQGLRCGQSTGQQACHVDAGCKPICPDKVAALSGEQYQDYAFIIIYWLFFLYLGLVNWRFCYWDHYPLFTQTLGKVSGAVTMAAGTWGALKDWQENDHILEALRELHLMAGPVPVMRDFAYEKWKFLFLAIAAAAPVFIFWTGKTNQADARPSALSHLMAWMTAFLAVTTGWTGFAACLYGDDHRLEVATERLDLVIVAAMLTLATAQLWRGGTLAGLDRLAKLPVLRFFPTLFSSEAGAPQTSDTDPNRIP